MDHVRQTLSGETLSAIGPRTMVERAQDLPNIGSASLDVSRKVPCGLPDQARLTEDITALAEEFDRYGYRQITGLLNNSGWHVNHKRFERIWRQEGLKVPQKQPKKGRLLLNDGSCVRLRPERPNHVWSYDFVQDRTHDGRIFRTLNIIDEFTKEAG